MLVFVLSDKSAAAGAAGLRSVSRVKFPKHITFDDDDENDDSEYNMTELSPTHVQRYI